MELNTRESALRQLIAVREAVGRTTTVLSILDPSWFDKLEAEIMQVEEGAPLSSDRAGLLATFGHPARGVAWFEEGQALYLQGKLNESTSGQAYALALLGVDPLLDFLPKLDARLQALTALPFKEDTVKAKLRQLRLTREDLSFRNHLFEASVVGDLATKGVLIDIEDGSSGVDGVVQLDGRPVLVEATNTTQELLKDFEGAMFVDIGREVKQVIDKVQNKVARGRQIALTAGRPALLFLALNRRGADSQSAEDAVQQCFANPNFAALSGVVVADSWKFLKTRWFLGLQPDVPLTKLESERFEIWYSRG